MIKTPFVSIIVPVYNAKTCIEECIKALLRQDYPKDKYEIIVIDNKSTDNTKSIINKFPVIYLLEDKTQTSYASRNTGIKQAKGEIIAFTDSDCVALETWLTNGIKGFCAANIGCVAGEIKGASPNSYVEEFLIQQNTLEQKAAVNSKFLPFAQTANVFYRKDVFKKIGNFEQKWISGGDCDFSWRMQLDSEYKLKYVPDSIVLHRHRSTLKSMFKQKVKWGIGRTLLYKKYRTHMQIRRLKETWRDLQTLCEIFYKFLRSYLWFNKEYFTLAERRKSLLIFVNYFGAKLGEFLGSIINRVYYV